MPIGLLNNKNVSVLLDFHISKQKLTDVSVNMDTTGTIKVMPAFMIKKQLIMEIISNFKIYKDNIMFLIINKVI